MVTELLQGVGKQLQCGLIGRFGIDEMVHGLRYPAILTSLIICAGAGQQGIGTARVIDKLAPVINIAQGIQVGRVGVVPAHVLLINRFGVALHRPVIATGKPLPGQARWHVLTHELGDFHRFVALVHQA
ncbi:hypothetical protein D3C71_1596120 [compost metagenome]